MSTLRCLLILFILPLTVLVQSGNSQTAEFKWVKQAGGNNNDIGFAIDMDNEGFIYWTGIVSDSLQFCDTTIVTGFADVFIAKMSPAGSLIWVELIGGPGWSESYGLKTDSQGNVIVVGAFSGVIEPGDTVLTGTGYHDVFIVKYNSTGNYLWSVQGTGSNFSNEDATCVTVDNQDYIIVGGYYEGSLNLGGLVISNSNGNKHSFVAQISPDGNVLWGWDNSDSPDTQSEPYSVTVDAQDNIIICGYYEGEFTAGSQTLTSLEGTDDLYLAKLSSSGDPLWLTGTSTYGYQYAYSVACDEQNYIYVTGTFSDTVSFGNTTLISDETGNDAFLARVNPNGNFTWAYQISGTSNESTWSVAYNLYSGISITGSFEQNIEIGSYSINSHGMFSALFNELGEVLNFFYAESTENADFATGCILDEVDNVYFTGRFHMNCTFGNTTLTSNGLSDAFLVKVHFDNSSGINSDGLNAIVFKLEQNYPNPFNPSTTIKWQIPETGFVTLKIYDVLGREVTTLVDEEFSAGKHEVDFDASRFSSGIYFYQLKAGEFTQTKKMILLK